MVRGNRDYLGGAQTDGREETVQRKREGESLGRTGGREWQKKSPGMLSGKVRQQVMENKGEITENKREGAKK